jgi:hypothetical protein
MIIHKDSHTDHAITKAQWGYILIMFEGRTGFFIDTIELPEGLGHVMNGLYGPSCGDAAIPESEVYYAPRPPRTWVSRMTKMPARPTRFVRVIAGPHDGHGCVLFTAYGVASKDMPVAPKEPGDLQKQIDDITPRYEAGRNDGTATVEDHELLHKLHAQLKESKPYWATHALATEAA